MPVNLKNPKLKTDWEDVLDIDSKTSFCVFGYKGRSCNKLVPVAKGKGTHAITSIAFDAVNARYFRITQTGSVNGLHWSIHEMSVFEKGGKVAEVAKVQPKEKKPKPRQANLDPKNPYHLVATDETVVYGY